MPILTISGTPVEKYEHAPTYIVYSLRDPVSMEVRYVGKSICGIKRCLDHKRPSNLNNDGNTPKANWIRSLIAQNKNYAIFIEYEHKASFESKEEINKVLYEKEQFFISLYMACGFRLTNLQDSGPGSVNRQVPTETRLKMSLSAKKRGLNSSLKAMQTSKHPPNRIITNEEFRFCVKCDCFENLYLFSGKARICNKQRYQMTKKQQSLRRRLPSGLKHHSIKKPVMAKQNGDSFFTIFTSFKEASTYLGGKANKTGIRLAVRNNKPYYNLYWSLV